MEKVSLFIKEAMRLGFVRVGFSRPGRPLFFDKFCEWIARGRQGGMNWLKGHMDLREDPGRLLDGCQTVITLAYPYSAIKPATPDGFTAARFTEPRKEDYHYRLRRLAKRLARHVVDLYPQGRTRVCVDSAPILERSFAYGSGIGFIGKNNMLIVPGYGSYVFLMEILTTALFSYSKAETMENQCGTCTRCVNACPTGALEAPFSFDASKCLSYLTIEHRGVINNETGQKMGGCFYGCDICQEVCPFNAGGSLIDISLPSTDGILNMGEEDFTRRFGRTAFTRAGLERLKENIRASRP